MQDLKSCLLPRKSSHELPGENEGNASTLLLGFDPLDSLLIQGQRSVTNYQTLKRVLDIGLALPILVFALPPLLILMLLVLCTSGWPIFYPQLRVGLHGRPFRMYKLRTMVVNADHYLRQQIGLAHTWQLQGKLRNDPRVTRLGRLLRRSSLDELPQILNILRGEMSLVGPRPIQFSELDRFGTFSELRHSVRPGLTCFWQVQGRSQLGYEQRCLLDCLYILKCSLREDLRILVRTFPVVLTGKGAY